MNTLRITTINYSGLTSEMTFFPDTGGTINIGTVTLPYDYVSPYPYGLYSLFFPSFGTTCSLFVTDPSIQFLLDVFTGSAVAYSLNRIKSSTTNVVRVRRSNDNTESDFTAEQLKNGTFETWLGAGNDGFVTVWYDQSGGGRHLSNSTTSTQPVIALNGIYLGDIYFGNNQILSLDTDYYVFGVDNKMSIYETSYFDVLAAGSSRLYNFGNLQASTFNEATTLGSTSRFYTPGVPNQMRSNVYLNLSNNINLYSTNFGGTSDDGVQQVIRIWRNKNNLTNSLNINRDQWTNGDFRSIGGQTPTGTIIRRRDFIIYPDDRSDFEDVINYIANDYPIRLLDYVSSTAEATRTTAYSLRRLRTATINAVRVRRSSDNTESNFTPEEVSDGTLASWVGAGNDGFVTIWYDQSGTVNLSQAVAAEQPQIVENGVVLLSDGFPSIRFDGVNDLLQSSLILSGHIEPSLYSSFAVINPTLISSNFSDTYENDTVWGDTGGYAGLHLKNSPSRAFAYNWDGNDDSVGLSINLSKNNLIFQQHKNNQIILSVNGSDEVSTASNNTQFLTGVFRIGMNYTTKRYNGFISELVFYKTDESVNKDILQKNINDYYDIIDNVEYLLDEYPGAAVAFSLRQLRSGVTNVIRVRRSSDNSEQDFTANEITDGTLTSWVGSGNNGSVTRWYDQSLNGNHLNQSVTVNQFVLVLNGNLNLINGKPSASATLPQTSVRGPYVLTTQASNSIRSFFTVAKINTQSTVNYLCYNEGGGGIQSGGIFQNGSFGGVNGMGGFDNVNVRSITGEDLNQTLGYVNLTSGSLFAAKNNATAVNAGSFVTDLSINSVFGRNSSFGAFRGEAQEFIAYPFEQSINKTEIGNKINNYYKIF